MNEIITSIVATSFDYKDFDYKDYEYDGLVITTNKQEIKIGIQNDQFCCENWGFLTSNDNYDDFKESELYSIEIVDEKQSIIDYNIEDDYSGSCLFVNIKTSKGLLQIVLYNEHNGYYSHDVIIFSNQLNFENSL